MYDYWRRQDAGKSLFDSQVDTLRPEQIQLAGKLAIVGGRAQAFFAVSSAFQVANATGIAEATIILPDSLKNKIPNSENMRFLAAEASGGFAADALPDLLAATRGVDAVLLVGDFGKSHETAMLLNDYLAQTTAKVIMARDTVDLVMDRVADWASRDGLTICLSLKQLQKFTQQLYYPRMITMTMPMNQIVEALHKMTLSIPATMITLGDGQIIVAEDGQVVSTPLQDTEWTSVAFWDGRLMARGAVLGIWNKTVSPLQVWSRAFLK